MNSEMETSVLIEALTSAESKKQVTKLPTFTGEKTDTLSPSEFVDRVETAAKAAKWSKEDKAFHFALALEGSAAKWFKVTADDRVDDWQSDFDEIAKEFIAWFEPAATGTRTLAGVRDMKQRSNEKVANFAIRIKEAALLWRRFAPMPDFAKTTEERGLVRSGIRIGFDQMGLAMFCLGLGQSDIQQKVLDASPKTLNEAIRLAVDLELARSNLKETKEISATKVAMVDGDESSEEDERGEVDAVHKGRQNRMKNQSRKTYGGQGNQQENGQNRATFSCYYCKKPGHRQNRCYKRIADRAPQVDRYGKPFSSSNTNTQAQPVGPSGTVHTIGHNQGNSGSLNFLGVA